MSGLRIALLAPNLAFGKSGVADYALHFADGLKSAGHVVTLIGWNEPEQPPPAPPHKHFSLPATLSTVEKCARMRDYFQSNPQDWVSLQFVAYGFHPQGMVFDLGVPLREAHQGPWHILYHEIWVGASRFAPLRHKTLGWAQKLAIANMARQLRPQLSHATNAVYRRLLHSIGTEADLLPLFGNVPVVDHGTAVVSGTKKSHMRFGIFGSLHPVWPPEPLFKYLLQAGKELGRTVEIVSLGRLGAGENLWHNLEKEYGGRIQFRKKGEISAIELSAEFAALDYGIATTPLELLEKSGSAVAMLEHGLPLLVNRHEDYGFAVETPDRYNPLVIRMDSSLPTRLRRGVRRGQARWKRDEVVARFLDDLAKVTV